MIRLIVGAWYDIDFEATSIDCHSYIGTAKFYGYHNGDLMFQTPAQILSISMGIIQENSIFEVEDIVSISSIQEDMVHIQNDCNKKDQEITDWLA